MRILLDQGLAPKAAELLRLAGFDALHVQEIGMHAAQDIEIMDYARNNNRACVTIDHDFHAHLALTQLSSPSVILLRLEGLSSSAQSELIQQVWLHCSTAIETGAAVTVNTKSIRVRKLPIH